MENMIKSFWDRNKIILKSFFIGMLVLLLLIPTVFIQNLVSERQSRQQEAVSEISSKWAGSQTVTGPVIGIPYTETTGACDMAHESLGRLTADEVRRSALLHLVNMGAGILTRPQTMSQKNSHAYTKQDDRAYQRQ